MAMSGSGDISGGADGSPNTIKQVIPGVDQTTGALTYTYPLKMPPGRNGMQPDLSLSYNSLSADSNSIVGYGWSLNIPYIKRINKDGVNKLYSENYFESSLSGELVPYPTSSTSIFRSKVDNGEFLNYTFASNTWTVTDKSGKTYTFGNSSSTQLVDDASSTRIFAWMLNEVRDLNGNYMTYEYYKAYGQIYPNKIYYTQYGTSTAPFEIEFSRESRSDGYVKYDMGFAASSTYRIKEITAKHNGTWTKKYTLGYATSTTGIRSLLDTITESGFSDASATTTLPATDFDYQSNLPTGVSTLFETQTIYDVTCPANINTTQGVIISDVNSDGLPDILEANNSETATYLNTGIFDGTSTWATSTMFNSPLLFSNASSTDLGVRLADINGDGRIDLVKRVNSSSTIYFNTSSGWSLHTSTSTWVIPEDTANSDGSDNGVRLVDLTGDGLPDFIQTTTGGGSNTHVWVNNGSNWVSDSGWDTFPQGILQDHPMFVDLNNDGLMDDIQSSVSGVNWHHWAYLNNGKGGWVAASQYDPAAMYYFNYNGNDWGTREADINGDGFSDLLQGKNLLGTAAHVNTGLGWSTSSWSGLEFVDNGSHDNGYRFADYNGDGMVDILNCKTGGSADIFLKNQQLKPDLLTRIKLPTGGSTAVAYQPTTKYVTGASSTLLNANLPFVIDTVSTITKSDNVSPTSTQTFSYEGGQQYFAGALDRKMAGFAKVVSTDTASNTTSVFYHQGDSSSSSTGEYNDDVFKIGKVYRTEVADSSGNIYSKTINKWDEATSTTSSSTFVNLAQTISFSYDGDADHKEKAESYTYSTSTSNLLTKTQWGEVTGSNDGTFSDTGSDKFITTYTYASSTASSTTSSTVELYTTSFYSDSSLIAYWRLEGGLSDSKGSSNGTNHSVTFATSTGKFNQGGHFASGSYFNGSITQPTSSYSVSAWLSHSSASNDNNEGIWDTQNPVQAYWETGMTFAYNPSIGKFRVYHGNGSWQDSNDVGSTFEDGLMHHVVVTWTGTTSTFYLDGSSIGSTSHSRAMNNDGSYQIGQRTTNDQPWYGNMDDIAIFSRALTSGEVHDIYSIFVSSPSNFSLLASESTVDASSTKVKESRVYYDSLALGSVSKGNSTKQESWKSSSDYASSTKVYNSYGLVTSATDPRGKTTTYSYDTFNLYVATSTNPLSQTTGYLYDYSLGKPKQITDANGLVSQTVFDGVDRVTEEKQPDLASPSSLVTKATYAYTYQSPVGLMVKQSQYLDGSNIVDRYTYTDGFGRTIQTRQETEDSFAVSDIVYNNIDKVLKESLPYFSSGASSTTATAVATLYTNYTYDSLYRVSTTTNSVGTTTMAYDDWKTTIIDPMGTPKSLYKDAYGNLKQVDETIGTSTVSTAYTYNYLQNLTGITDALGNIRSFTYDGLGRRLTAQDLHVSGDGTYGSYTYTYDDAGNLTQQVDPTSQTVNFTYDDLSRPLTEDYTGASSTEITYTYDSCTYGVGRLCSTSSTDVLATSTYNALGLVATSTKSISGTAYSTTYSYDRVGNVLETINPDVSRVKNTYNAGGFLETIQRKESTDGDYIDVVTDFDYGPHGKVTEIDYENGAITENTYDSSKQYRLLRKLTTVPAGESMMRSFSMIEPDVELLESKEGSTSTLEMSSSTPEEASSILEESTSTVFEATSTSEQAEATSTMESSESAQSAESATPTEEEQQEEASSTPTSFLPRYTGLTLRDVFSILAEVFTIKTALASGPIELYDTSLYNDGNLLNYYRLEGNVNDSKGSSNGTNHSVTFSTSTGMFGQGGHFASGTYFNGSTTQPTSTYSISVWLSHSSASNDNNEAIWDTQHPTEWETGITTAYNPYLGKFRVYHGNGSWQDSSNVGTYFEDGVMHHLVITWTGSVTTFYLDGSNIGSGSYTRAVYNDGSFQIGQRTANDQPWYGNMDDFAIFSRALSEEEVADLYYGTEGVPIQDLNYTYDANGNITKIIDSSETDTYKVTDYTYDTLNRLTNASSSLAATSTNYNYTYVYNAIGNITSSTPSGVYLYPTTTSGYVNPHGAVSIGGATYAYDNNGNLTSDGTWTHSWDYRNRLTQSSSSVKLISYNYDASNSRVKMVTPSSTTIIPFPTYSTEAGSAVKYISANGQLIATIRGSTTTAAVYYTHPDHLGSQEKTTDSDTTVSELSSYDPFGAVRLNESTVHDRRSFLGKDLDLDTGLSQLEARFYKGAVGRFISQDPMFWELKQNLQDPQSLNSYGYAGNNPIRFSDPTGRDYLELSFSGTYFFVSGGAGLRLDQNGIDWFVFGGPALATPGGYLEGRYSNGNLTHQSETTVSRTGKAAAGLGFSISSEGEYDSSDPLGGGRNRTTESAFILGGGVSISQDYSYSHKMKIWGNTFEEGPYIGPFSTQEYKNRDTISRQGNTTLSSYRAPASQSSGSQRTTGSASYQQQQINIITQLIGLYQQVLNIQTGQPGGKR